GLFRSIERPRHETRLAARVHVSADRGRWWIQAIRLRAVLAGVRVRTDRAHAPRHREPSGRSQSTRQAAGHGPYRPTSVRVRRRMVTAHRAPLRVAGSGGDGAAKTSWLDCRRPRLAHRAPGRASAMGSELDGAGHRQRAAADRALSPYGDPGNGAALRDAESRLHAPHE